MNARDMADARIWQGCSLLPVEMRWMVLQRSEATFPDSLPFLFAMAALWWSGATSPV
jgi:hypothetical protein